MRLADVQIQRDEELCARLAGGRAPVLEAAARLRPLARSGATSLLDALVAHGHLTLRELQAGARAWRADPPQPLRWGNWGVLGEAGRGAHGVVYWARRLSDGAPAALKLLRAPVGGGSNDAARFLREARLLARLEHPGIVRLLDAGEDDGLLWHATEAVLGGSLAEVPLQPPGRALALCGAVARALSHAHGAGVVHRDLKPQNVLLTHDGHPRLVDFGLAGEAGGSGALTGSGSLLGTLHWAAPEQLVAAGRVGAAADVYALGAMLHALITGEPPFADARTFGAYYSRARAGFPGIGPRPEIRPEGIELLDAVLREALRLDPAARPTSRSLAETLEFARAAIRW